MGETWLEFEDGQETRRVPLTGSLTRVGGAAPDISMGGLPGGELHVWNDPPKVVRVAGDARLAVNGVEGREMLLSDGDRVEWGDVRFRFVCEASAPVLQEISVAEPAPVPVLVTPGGGGAAWARVRAGIAVDIGLADKAVVKRWQDSVMRGDYAPEACARDLVAGLEVDGDDPRMVERSARLLKDFLMSSMLSGASGAKRRARQVGKKGAAIFISQLLVVGVYTLILAVALLLLRAGFPDFSLDGWFDSILGRG